MRPASGLDVLLTNGIIATLYGSCCSSSTVGAGGGNSISFMAQEVAPIVKQIIIDIEITAFFIFIGFSKFCVDPVCINLVRFAHNWNDGKIEYWARSEALALYWVFFASH
jgi:hypothetical protein